MNLTEVKVDDIVEARFTNCYNFYSFKAKVVKVNKSSCRVVSLEKDKPYLNEPGREFVVPLFTFGSYKLCTINNGVFKIA